MACDFVDIDNIKWTQLLVSELRSQHLSTKSGNNVLQLNATVWYAWTWLRKHEYFPSREANFLLGVNDLEVLDIDGHDVEPETCGDEGLSTLDIPKSVCAIKNKAKCKETKWKKAFEERSRKVDYNCPCPLCHMPFQCCGLIEHLCVYRNIVQICLATDYLTGLGKHMSMSSMPVGCNRKRRGSVGRRFTSQIRGLLNGL